MKLNRRIVGVAVRNVVEVPKAVVLFHCSDQLQRENIKVLLFLVGYFGV